MNNAILNGVSQIISRYGEKILDDSKRVNELLSSIAPNEPKSERIALVKCLMNGCHQELKKCRPAGPSRAQCKAGLVKKLTRDAGIGPALAGDTLDLLEMALFGVVTSRPSLPPVPTASFLNPLPAMENIPVKKIGGGLQKGISAAGAAGAEVIKAAGEVVKSGYEAIGGAEGVQKGAEVAGKVATEVLKIGTILAIEAGKVIINTVKGVAEEAQKSRDASGNRSLLNGPDDYADYYIIDDDDD